MSAPQEFHPDELMLQLVLLCLVIAGMWRGFTYPITLGIFVVLGFFYLPDINEMIPKQRNEIHGTKPSESTPGVPADIAHEMQTLKNEVNRLNLLIAFKVGTKKDSGEHS